MNRTKFLLLLVGATSLSAPLAAQPAPAAQAAQAAPAAPVLEEEALAAIGRVQAFLKTVKTLELRADVTTQEVYNSGQKITYGQRFVYRIERPNRLQLDFKSDLMTRRIFFDGSRTTVVDPGNGVYAQFDKAGTVGELFDAAEQNYGIELPLADLLDWGDPNFTPERPASGFVVGPALVGNARTTHYAFRTPGIDYELWILDGDVPLPVKVAITNTDDPAQPQYVATLSWNLTPTFAADAFLFTPGPKDVKVPFRAPSKAVATATGGRE